MFKPTPLNRTYHLSGFQFNIYSIDGFDFQEELDLPHTNGVYCFSTPLTGENLGTINTQTFHILQYLGRTKDFAERFEGHHKAGDLSGLKPLCVSIYYCDNECEEERIENQILSQYSFPLNVVGNRQFPKDLPTIVKED